MNAKLQTTDTEWRDPIVHELHIVREKLVEKYHGNFQTYSQAAKTHSLALGFQFATRLPSTTANRTNP